MKELEPIEVKGERIVLLFLEKLEKLNDRERAVIISSIDLLNKPIFITSPINNLKENK